MVLGCNLSEARQSIYYKASPGAILSSILISEPHHCHNHHTNNALYSSFFHVHTHTYIYTHIHIFTPHTRLLSLQAMVRMRQRKERQAELYARNMELYGTAEAPGEKEAKDTEGEKGKETGGGGEKSEKKKVMQPKLGF